MNKFDNHSNESLADLIGAEDEYVKANTARLDELKAEAKRRGIEVASGTKYRIVISRVEQTRLDTKAVRESLCDAIKQFERGVVTTTLRITPLFQQPEIDQ